MSQNKPFSPNLKPIRFGQALPLFAVPAVVTAFSYHFLIPAFVSIGLSELEAYLVAHILPMALLFTAAIVAYGQVEGNPLTMQAFRQRFRLTKLTFKTFAIGVGVFILANLGYGLFNQAAVILIQQGIIFLPESIPPLADPNVGFTTASLSQMLGTPIAGRWDIVAVWFIMLFFNVVGEELWWRGFILPRQEIVHGKWTWVVHGLLWCGFHAFKWWDLFGLLPVCLLVAFSAQKTKSTTVALITHFLFNGLALILVIGSVTGIL